MGLKTKCHSNFPRPTRPAQHDSRRRQYVRLSEEDRAQQPFEAEPLRDRDQHRQCKSCHRTHVVLSDQLLTPMQALTDLENNVPDLKSSLRPLQFVSAREV